MSVSIVELQNQRRWVLWRFVQKPGRDKPDKVPFQRDGKMARTNDSSTWSTHAECAAVLSSFDGVGLVLGNVDGAMVWGVDIDGCCDALTGKFTPESREVVIGLDSYGEYSPSGIGLVVGLRTGIEFSPTDTRCWMPPNCGTDACMRRTPSLSTDELGASR